MTDDRREPLVEVDYSHLEERILALMGGDEVVSMHIYQYHSEPLHVDSFNLLFPKPEKHRPEFTHPRSPRESHRNRRR